VRFVADGMGDRPWAPRLSFHPAPKPPDAAPDRDNSDSSEDD
jgi:hypothetical protein